MFIFKPLLPGLASTCPSRSAHPQYSSRLIFSRRCVWVLQLSFVAPSSIPSFSCLSICEAQANLLVLQTPQDTDMAKAQGVCR